MTEFLHLLPVRRQRRAVPSAPAAGFARRFALIVLASLTLSAAAPVTAQEMREAGAGSAGAARGPADAPVLALSASASRELPNDRLVVVLYVEREASDAASAQAQVNALLGPALERLRAARPALEIDGSGWRTWPMSAEGRIRSWRARAGVTVRGEPSPELSALIGQLSGMLAIESLRHELSRAARERAELELLSEAASSFRDKAQAGARALGYREATLRSVSLNQAQSGPVMTTMRASSAPMLSSAAAPIVSPEGQSTVTVSLEGSVWLSR